MTWRVPFSPRRTVLEVFEAYTDETAFTRSMTQVKMFKGESRLISRSEARRIAAGLDRFTEVVLDFANVDQVGQGFADELFRVWASRQPGVQLRPVNMSAAVELMVRRALRRSDADRPRDGIAPDYTTSTSSSTSDGRYDIDSDGSSK